jgi:putative acetyltransferase
MTVTIRVAIDSDLQYLIDWLLQPGVLEGFPLEGMREIEDAAKIWLSYKQYGAVLTALYDGVPCGIANLYLQPYKKLAHQCLFAIIVDEKLRGKGVGTQLIEALIKVAKEQFHITLLHLEVYEGNPAIRLYERFGFQKYGTQRHFVKDAGVYKAKIMMQKKLVGD